MTPGSPRGDIRADGYHRSSDCGSLLGERGSIPFQPRCEAASATEPGPALSLRSRSGTGRKPGALISSLEQYCCRCRTILADGPGHPRLRLPPRLGVTGRGSVTYGGFTRSLCRSPRNQRPLSNRTCALCAIMSPSPGNELALKPIVNKTELQRCRKLSRATNDAITPSSQ